MERILLCGAAARAWRIRGEGFKGTGKRSRAKIWKTSVSGKTNRYINRPKEDTGDLVAVFSDSQLRPLVQGDVQVPANWYVNSTPGGCFNHVKEEMVNAKFPDGVKPQTVVLLVGTNDLSRHVLMDKAKGDFHGLLLTAKKTFSDSRIIAVSILPRLDEYWIREQQYHNIMVEECKKLGVHFLDVTPNFGLNDRRLWSWRDGLHISEDKGLPLLMCLMKNEIRDQKSKEEASESLPAPPPPPPLPPTKPECPKWLWRELRHHRSEGPVKHVKEPAPPETKRKKAPLNHRLPRKRTLPSRTPRRIVEWNAATSRGIIHDNVLLTTTNAGLYKSKISQSGKSVAKSRSYDVSKEQGCKRMKPRITLSEKYRSKDPLDLIRLMENLSNNRRKRESGMAGKRVKPASFKPETGLLPSYASVVNGKKLTPLNKKGVRSSDSDVKESKDHGQGSEKGVRSSDSDVKESKDHGQGSEKGVRSSDSDVKESKDHGQGSEKGVRSSDSDVKESKDHGQGSEKGVRFSDSDVKESKDHGQGSEKGVRSSDSDVKESKDHGQGSEKGVRSSDSDVKESKDHGQGSEKGVRSIDSDVKESKDHGQGSEKGVRSSDSDVKESKDHGQGSEKGVRSSDSDVKESKDHGQGSEESGDTSILGIEDSGQSKGIVKVIEEHVCGGGRGRKKTVSFDIDRFARVVSQHCRVDTEGKVYGFDWVSIFKEFHGRSYANHRNAMEHFRGFYYKNKANIDEKICQIMPFKGEKDQNSFTASGNKISTLSEVEDCGPAMET
eukprot:gene10885-19712_t